MGGIGSTRWYWHRKKQIVERSEKLSINELMRTVPRDALAGRQFYDGTVMIGDKTGEQTGGLIILLPVHYTLVWDEDTVEMDIHYQCLSRNGLGLEWQMQTVGLQTTPCYIGNVRYWFTCPGCGKRVGCLYLPTQGREFRCRVCHDLVYRSAQMAHESALVIVYKQQVQKLRMLIHQIKGLHAGTKKFKRIWAKINETIENLDSLREATEAASVKRHQALIEPYCDGIDRLGADE
jgi:hypothetical protein